VTVKNVWADVTGQKLKDVKDQIKALERLEITIRSQCNHTYPDGTSALEEWHDSDPYGPSGPTSGHSCKVCHSVV
jgi:hypothetical protein